MPTKKVSSKIQAVIASFRRHKTGIIELLRNTEIKTDTMPTIITREITTKITNSTQKNTKSNMESDITKMANLDRHHMECTMQECKVRKEITHTVTIDRTRIKLRVPAITTTMTNYNSNIKSGQHTKSKHLKSSPKLLPTPGEI